MVDGVDQEATPETGVTETILGSREFRGTVEHREPGAPELKPAPEGIPEKFWDPVEGKLRADDLVKSYSELEKRIGAPKAAEEEEVEEPGQDDAEPDPEPDAEPEAEPDPEPDAEPDDGAEPAPLAKAMDAAAAVFAETGELPEEARAPLKELGI